MAKTGKHSVGVNHQYCNSVGKQDNCQVSVELVVVMALWPRQWPDGFICR